MNIKKGKIMKKIDIVNEVLRTLASDNPRQALKYFTSDFVFSGATPEPVGGSEYVEIHAALKKAFPDWQFNSSSLAEKGDSVTGFVQVSGTHKGTLEIPGLPTVSATGKSVKNAREGFTCTFEGDKISEFKVEKVRGSGLLGLFQQIGAKLPEPAMV
jgi:predicted ester cyclase